MQKMLAAETWTVQPSGTADTRVFNSSKELFLMLKRQYKRASALNMSAVLHQLLQKARLLQHSLPHTSRTHPRTYLLRYGASA